MLENSLNARVATFVRDRPVRRGGAGLRRVTRLNIQTLSSPEEATELARELATVPLFKNLAPEILGPIIALGRLTPMSSGMFFFNEGDDAERFFVLTRGRVKLTQLTPEGHQVVLGHIGPGDAFGGVGAFGDPSYPVSAEPVESSRALTWT